MHETVNDRLVAYYVMKLCLFYGSVMSSEAVGHHLQAQELYQLAQYLRVIKLCIVLYTTVCIVSSLVNNDRLLTKNLKSFVL